MAASLTLEDKEQNKVVLLIKNKYKIINKAYNSQLTRVSLLVNNKVLYEIFFLLFIKHIKN